MQRALVSALILAGAFAGTAAFAAKPCEELKGEIAKKLDDKGVKDYTLDIVANADVADKTVVGSCEGGTKKIVYAKK